MDTDHLTIPEFLDALAIRGMAKSKLPAYGAALREKLRGEAGRVMPGAAARTSLLNDRDRAAIAEIESGQHRRAEGAFKNRMVRVRERRDPTRRPSYYDTSRGRWVHPDLEVTKTEMAPAPATGEPAMAKKAKKVKKENGAGRAIGQPHGKVEDFVPVRAGTARAKVVELGSNGEHTVAQIASRIGKDRKTVLTHLFCLSRDSAIGYEVDENDRVKLSFPGSKTAKDAIKAPAEAS